MIRRQRLCIALVCAALAPAAWAKDAAPRKEFRSEALASRWQFWAGGLLASFDTQAAFAPSGFAGGLIQLESDLGLEEDVDTLTLGGTYRFGPRGSLLVSYNSVSRDAIRETSREIEWGDLVFDLGAEITTTLDIDQFKVYWRHDFSDSERLNAGISAGFSTFLIDASLAGQASLEGDGSSGSVEGRSDGSDFVAPIPLVGFFVDYALAPRWVLRATMNTIRIDYNDTSARVIDSGLTMEFYPTKVFGLGAGFTNSDMEYSKIDKDEKLAVGYQVNGFSAYASFCF